MTTSKKDPFNTELPEEFLTSLAALDGGFDMVETIRNSLPKPGTLKQDARSLAEILSLIEKLTAKQEQSGMNKWFSEESEYPIWTLPKHAEFFRASADYNEVLFLAGNRVGKSVAGAFALSCHLTGIYPSWWNGRVFDEPIKAWAVGKDARAVRDTLQKELLGGIGEWGTGMLPAHTLGKAFALQGTPQAIDIVRIKHVTGGWSELGFKNYQQDIGSFMGTARHVVLGDEEMPMDIYNECNVRTATTNGLMLLTFTPLDGLTPLVVNFCKRADYLVGTKPIVAMDQDTENMDDDGGFQVVGAGVNKAVIQAGWDDVPWLDEKTKARLLDDTPIHLREARSKGLPAMGSGNVYATPLESILVQPFAIPDSWPRMFALDVGWNRTACVWAALDPATDTIYFFDEHYMGKELPAVHAYSILSRGDWIHGVIDPAAHGRSANDGQKIRQTYKDLGLTLWDAKNEVESGILNLSQRFQVGKAKVFSTLINFQKEYMLYRRDKNGKVVKENDHLMDAARYIINNSNRMSSKTESKGTINLKYTPTRYKV